MARTAWLFGASVLAGVAFVESSASLAEPPAPRVTARVVEVSLVAEDKEGTPKRQ